MRNWICHAAMACFVVTTWAGTNGVAAETLKTAIERALDEHPEVRALRYNRKAIGQELEAAKGLWRPTVDIVKRAGGYFDDNRSSDTFQIGLTVGQQLFDGGRADYEITRQKERVSSAKLRVADTANAIALRVAQAYLEVMRARQVRQVASQNLRQLRRIAGRVASRVRGGKGNSAETAQAAARVAAARAAFAEAEQRLRDAHSLYLSVAGKRPGRLRQVRVPINYLPRNVNLAVREARKHSPKILALHHDSLGAQAAIGSARSILMPRFDVELSANYANRIRGVRTKEENLKALLVAKWNLFNGGINRARVREAKFRASEARSLAFAAALNVEREVRLSWSAIEASAVRQSALHTQLRNNRKSLRYQIKQFDIGKRTLLDILDTQNEIFTTYTVLTNEAFVAKFSSFRVLAAMGRLVKAMHIPMRGVD